MRQIANVFAVVGTIAFNGWLVAFHYEQFVLSVLPIVFLLGTLILLYLRMGIAKTRVSPRDELLIHILFSVYLGWITAAVMMNTTYILHHEGFRDNAEAWTVILFVVSAGLGVTALLSRHDMAYALVIIWALGFIGIRYQETDLIASSAFVVAGITFAAIILSFFIHPVSNQLIQKQSI